MEFLQFSAWGSGRSARLGERSQLRGARDRAEHMKMGIDNNRVKCHNMRSYLEIKAERMVKRCPILGAASQTSQIGHAGGLEHTLSLKRNAPWIHWLPLWPRVKVKCPRQGSIWSLSPTAQTKWKALQSSSIFTLLKRKRNFSWCVSFWDWVYIGQKKKVNSPHS